MPWPEPADLHPTAWALLQALAAQPAGQCVSLPRLGKQLGQGSSVLLRWLSLMGDAVVGGEAGPGWVVLAQADGRWVAQLTEAGRAFVEAVAPPHAHGEMAVDGPQPDLRAAPARAQG